MWLVGMVESLLVDESSSAVVMVLMDWEDGAGPGCGGLGEIVT